MRSDPRQINDEDRVNELWDRMNGTQAERSYLLLPNPADTIDHATISLLASMVQPVEENSLARIRQKFEAGIEKELAMSTVTHGRQATGSLTQGKTASSHAPRRLRRIPRTLNWIAAAVLVVAIVGTALVAGPGRDWLPEPVEHQLAALPGFETEQQSRPAAQGDHSLVSISLEPGASDTGKIEVRLWRVTLAPGASFDVPDSLWSLGKFPVDQYLESGTLTMGKDGEVKVVTSKQDGGIAGGAAYYRNDGAESVVMLMLAPSGETFPFTISTAPDTSTPGAMITGSQTTLLGTNTVSQDDGYQMRITLMTAHNVGLLDPAHFIAGTPAYIVIQQGEITMNRAANAGTQAPGTVYGAGETIQFATAEQRNATFTDTGSTPLSALMVTTSPGSATPNVITLRADVKNCHIEPMTPDDLRRLDSTPTPRNPSEDRSVLNEPGGSPPDEATATGVLDMLKSYVECAWSSKPGAGYTFFSDEALRDHATVFITDLQTSRLIDAQGIMPATVSDIRVFDDGRDGVRFAVHGEDAYLTLVQQNGEWKIDVWDDTSVSATPQP